MIDVVVPAEQEGTKAVVRAWLRKVGDRVQANDPLVELETDKVAMEVAAPADGVLQEIVLARDVFVLLDHDLHPWWMLVDSVKTASNIGDKSTTMARILQINLLRNTHKRKKHLSWNELLPLVGSAGCSDVRDKAYGVLGLIQPNARIPINYGIDVDMVAERIIEKEYRVRAGQKFSTVRGRPLKDADFENFVHNLLISFYGSSSGVRGVLPNDLMFLKPMFVSY